MFVYNNKEHSVVLTSSEKMEYEFDINEKELNEFVIKFLKKEFTHFDQTSLENINFFAKDLPNDDADLQKIQILAQQIGNYQKYLAEFNQNLNEAEESFQEKIDFYESMLTLILQLPDEEKSAYEELIEEFNELLDFAKIEIHSYKEMLKTQFADDPQKAKEFLEHSHSEDYIYANFRAFFAPVKESYANLATQIHTFRSLLLMQQNPKIDELFKETIRKMEKGNVELEKLPRSRHKFLPYSFTIFRDGSETHILRHTHKKEVVLTKGVASIQEAMIGKGGIKNVWPLVNLEGEIRFVRAPLIKRENVGKYSDATKVKAFHQHPHIMVGHSMKHLSVQNKTPQETFITPYMTGENVNLEDLIYSDAIIPEKTVIKALLQSVDALKTTHAHKFCHLDLKPENIYGTFNPTNPSDIHIKIADWDLARDFGQKGDLIERVVGSPDFMSPEMARNLEEGARINFEQGQKSDIFSLGILTYQFLTRSALEYDTDDAKKSLEFKSTLTYQDIQNLGFQKPDEKSALGLIWDMINPDWKLRPTLDQIQTRAEDLLKTL